MGGFGDVVCGVWAGVASARVPLPAASRRFRSSARKERVRWKAVVNILTLER